MTTVFGRDDDLKRARSALTRAGWCTLIGPGGVGKSTLMSAIVDSLGERAMLLDARAISRADHLISELAMRLDVDHTIEGGTGGDVRVYVQLAQHMGAVGMELLAVDHVDDLDQDVMGVLTGLAAESSDLTVLVATRNHPVIPFGEVVPLRPLDLDAADEATEPASKALFRDAFSRAGGDPRTLDEDATTTRRIVEASGGLPLAIIVGASRAALIGLAAAVPDEDDAGWDDNSAPDADVVGTALHASLRDIDEDAQRLFRAVGVMRSDPTIEQLADVSGMDRSSASSAVEQLARRSLLEVVDGRVRMLPPVRRIARHLGAASDDRASLERRLRRWAEGMSRADPPPSTTDVLAVEADLIGAMASRVDEDRMDLTLSIAKLLDNALHADLRHERRVEVLEPILQRCRKASERQRDSHQGVDDLLGIMALTAMAYADASRSTTATRLLEEALTLTDRSSRPDEHRARIESRLADLSFRAGDLHSAHENAESALDSAERAGEDLTRHRATKLLAEVALERGDLDDALAIADAALRNVPRSAPWLADYALALVAACELERGAYAIADAAAERIARAARRRGDTDLLVEADWLSATVDPRAPLRHPYEFDGNRRGNSVIHLQADLASALRHLSASAPDSAITHAADCELRAIALPMRPLAIDAQLLVGAAAVQLGSIPEATRAYRQAVIDSTRFGYRLRVPDAVDGLADVLAALDPTDATPNAIRAAAASIRAQLGAVRRPAPWRSGTARPGRRPPNGWVEGGELTEFGLQALLSMQIDSGSAPTISRSRLAPLSPAEHRVAELVAEGHTNREIAARLYVSRRTVETHIAHAFQKLAVRSRTQLAAIVLQELNR